MPKDLRDVMRHIVEPLGVFSTSGDAIEANSAFEKLAEDAGLAHLFGPGVAELIEQALRAGSARAFLQLHRGPEPRPWYRVSISADPGSERVIVLATPMTEEMGWRRLLEERNRELAMLRDVGNALSGSVEIDQLSERIYAQTTLITRAGNFYIALHDRETGTISFPRYVENGLWQEMTSRPAGNGLTEYILRTGKPLLLNHNVIEEIRTRGIEPFGRPCCAWIGVPMISDGETMGVIGLQDYEHTGVYDEHDLELLSIIAAQAAASIKNARLLHSARRAYVELSETQARLLETERVRGVTETVGTLNHEINNPLAVIAGNAQLLLRKADTLAPDVRAKVENILDSSNRIQRVTGKMATLIQATSMPYPGEATILDLRRSLTEDEGPAGTAPSRAQEHPAS